MDWDRHGGTLVSAGGERRVSPSRLNDTGGPLSGPSGFGGGGNDGGLGVISAGGGRYVYLTGYFSGTADFDPGAGTNTRTANGLTDVFALKLGTGSGNYINAWAMGGTGSDFGNALVASTTDAVVVGRFTDTVDFDPYAGTQNLTSAGQTDAFVAAFPLVPPNLPPAAGDDAYATNEDVPLTVPVATGVLTGTRTPRGSTLTAALVDRRPARGLHPERRRVVHVPPGRHFNGSDSFTYRATDGSTRGDRHRHHDRPAGQRRPGRVPRPSRCGPSPEDTSMSGQNQRDRPGRGPDHLHHASRARSTAP